MGCDQGSALKPSRTSWTNSKARSAASYVCRSASRSAPALASPSRVLVMYLEGGVPVGGQVGSPRGVTPRVGFRAGDVLLEDTDVRGVVEDKLDRHLPRGALDRDAAPLARREGVRELA